MRRVAVTGIGVISPLGNDCEEFFDNLARGRSGIVRLPAPAHVRMPANPASKTAGPISAVRCRSMARAFSPPAAAHAGSGQPVRAGGGRRSRARCRSGVRGHDRQRAGVFIGTGMGGAQTTDEGYFTLYAEGSDRVKPYSVLMAMTNAAASWIGIEYGLTGPNLTYSTACSSSAVAIGEAARRIAGGEVDMMIAGGTEAPLNLWDAGRLGCVEDAGHRRSARSRRIVQAVCQGPDGPGAGRRRRHRGAGRLGACAARGAHIHAELAGYGFCTDASHITRPTVEGQAAAMRRALESAAMQPEDIGYINAHGTATLANDTVETAAIKQVFGARAFRIPVSSTKSMHGHLLGAAGALEFVAAVLALERQVIPPTINLQVPDPECDLDYVPGRPEPGSNSLLRCRTRLRSAAPTPSSFAARSDTMRRSDGP